MCSRSRFPESARCAVAWWMRDRRREAASPKSEIPLLLRRFFLRLVVEAGGRFRCKPAALQCQRLAAGQLPVSGCGAARKRLPAVGPIAQTVTMPGRLDAEWIKIELLPQRARVLHVVSRR